MAAGRPPIAPPHPSSSVHEPVTSQSRPVFQSGTYIVQIPKDQIYRIPPPENAEIFERHRKPEQSKRRSSICSWFSCFIIIALIIIAVGLALGLSFSFPEPKNPKFKIQRFVFVNSTSHSQPFYDIRLQVYNPNAKSDILYKKEGVISLFFKQQKLAAAKFPHFLQNDNTSTAKRILLKGSNTNWSSRTRGKVSLSLKMDIPVRMKISRFKTGDAVLAIACDLTVDKLGKGLKLVSEKCKTYR
ncbi:hypothetical protein JCGZ_15768 [Jatropha curcas]|uniref:Late embryogenesis abundant protein LEA-2 subgroup domain-containing protein n=1 Tax=Jatropha curcas TaxID=180498 RepID=A0A067JFM3_JATCU|nr:NDR1/HIN1-like protein 13 [Jatropha curcas]KDP22637.1 hypothetical protein JCGZ_02795 [Jatropha curcas]KDP41361.1 hypothetical protein JCGZ_15768 [Jatropha curcas]